MAKDLTAALEAVEMPYSEIKQIAEDMLAAQFQPLNDLVAEVQANINVLSVDALRDYMLRLQLNTFQLSELRDKTAVKAECAEAVKKEAYATSYLGQDGTAAQRDSNATIAISENIVVECLYDLVANLVKTKVDQSLRLIDTMKSILMSRMQEAKISNMLTAE